MSLYVYCRVSTEYQSLRRQIDNIVEAKDGAYRNAKDGTILYQEPGQQHLKFSGKEI